MITDMNTDFLLKSFVEAFVIAVIVSVIGFGIYWLAVDYTELFLKAFGIGIFITLWTWRYKEQP